MMTYYAIHINYKDGSDITYHLIYVDMWEAKAEAEHIKAQPSVKDTRIFPVRIYNNN